MNFTGNRVYIPVLLGCTLAIGVFLGNRLSPSPERSEASDKLRMVLDYIQQDYVDTLSADRLVENSITAMLEQLDPHSAYIPAEDLQSVNESLEGNFEGIGIEFHIQQDTITVVAALSGGPSERAGLQAGDRLVRVNGKDVTGKQTNNEFVQKTLRGKGGTAVTVGIMRKGLKGIRDYRIIRGKIPLNSVEISYMLDKQTGLVKISRFSATTYEETVEAIKNLKQQGMNRLIIDLRGNPGGFLDAATNLCDELLEDNRLMVYTQGKARSKTEYKTRKEGLFEHGPLAVLIDEGSASASEILAGAVQDWDRGLIIGRRSFGKGLVQEQTELPDGSAIRLTIARYYTPSGRCIQKPYSEGLDQYEDELSERLMHGEYSHADSIKPNDSLKFKTHSGRVVYGGGGIMPDYFVAIDTTHYSEYLQKLYAEGLISSFCYAYVDEERERLRNFSDARSFRNGFQADDALLSRFAAFAAKSGVSPDEKGLRVSGNFLRIQLKSGIARLLWQNAGMYPILLESDPFVLEALKRLN
jgi:carboxyl-terminal processing protease